MEDFIDELLGAQVLNVEGRVAHEWNVQLGGALRVEPPLNAVVGECNQPRRNNNTMSNVSNNARSKPMHFITHSEMSVSDLRILSSVIFM